MPRRLKAWIKEPPSHVMIGISGIIIGVLGILLGASLGEMGVALVKLAYNQSGLALHMARLMANLTSDAGVQAVATDIENTAREGQQLMAVILPQMRVANRFALILGIVSLAIGIYLLPHREATQKKKERKKSHA